MPKILLVDGPAIAYRAHFALGKANLATPEGKSTAATYGYTNALLKLLREEAPDYACVSFDTEKPTYRHRLFEEYKAGRPGMPEDLVHQLDWIKGITKALGVAIIEIDGYEADDVIGTLARIATERGIETVIATGDKDLLQLVNPSTRVIMLSGWGRDTKVMDQDDVVAKYGIAPDLLPDFFGLMGDAIDNVPGVPGIGRKTAGQLVKEYGRLESLYENIPSLPRKVLREKLLKHRDAAFSSRELVRVNRHAPIGSIFEDLRHHLIDQERIRDLFTKLHFRRLLRLVLPEGSRTSVEPKVWHRDKNGARNLEPLSDGWMSIDVNCGESVGAGSPILGVALSFESGGDYYFPLNHREPGNATKEDFLMTVGPLLSNAGVKKVVHDAKKVMLAMESMGTTVCGIELDTLLARYLMSPGEGGLEVEDIALDYLGEVAGEPGGKRHMESLVTVRQASETCCRRARTILGARKAMEDELRSRGLWDLLRRLELPLARVLADMERRGVRVDQSHLRRLSEDLDVRLAKAEKEAYALAGRRFNLNSPRDVSTILFKEIGLKPVRKTKTGYSTDLSVLTELSSEHELPRKILDYRQLSKLKSTYVDQLLRFSDASGGRIHARFNQAATATGRLSSSDPNLQNIPIRSQLGAEVRKAFVPSQPDWMLVSADYSQVELRIVAHLSGDEALIEAFRAGEDIHKSTAAIIFKVDPRHVTTGMRTIAKSVNFGIIYGMGANSLAKTTGITVGEATAFIGEHQRNYPRLYSFIEETLEAAREHGYVETMLGRKRPLPHINARQHSLRSAAERMAVNTPVQGSAADIIKLAMIGIHEEIENKGLKGGIVIQVHDEILVDCPEGEEEEMVSILRDEMSGAYRLSVPLKVEVSGGTNWYEAH